MQRLLSPEILSQYPSRFPVWIVEEAEEQLATLEAGVRQLPETLNNDYELQAMYRVTFAIRGILALLGYSSNIAAYGLDDCLRLAKETHALPHESTQAQFFLLVTLLRQTLVCAITQVSLETQVWTDLKHQSEAAVANLQEQLTAAINQNP